MINSQQSFDRGGRGGGGRGRGMSIAGGRGQGIAGRGDRAMGRAPSGPPPGRGASITRPSPTANSAQNQPVAPVAWDNQPAAVAIVASTASTGGLKGWGTGGLTLAEKLKQAEIQKSLPPVVVVVVEEVLPSEEIEEVCI